MARRCGVKVLRFSIGFGKAAKSWIGKDGVEYVIALIPLGGYVKMLGQEDTSVPSTVPFRRASVISLLPASLCGREWPLWQQALLQFSAGDFVFWLINVSYGVSGIARGQRVLDESAAETAGLRER